MRFIVIHTPYRRVAKGLRVFLAVGILAATFEDIWILKAFHQEGAKDQAGYFDLADNWHHQYSLLTS